MVWKLWIFNHVTVETLKNIFLPLLIISWSISNSTTYKTNSYFVEEMEQLSCQTGFQKTSHNHSQGDSYNGNGTLRIMTLRIDTQNNNTQNNDTQNNDTQNNDTQNNDTQNNYTQNNSTQNNDTQNNDTL